MTKLEVTHFISKDTANAIAQSHTKRYANDYLKKTLKLFTFWHDFITVASQFTVLHLTTCTPLSDAYFSTEMSKFYSA